MKRILVIDDSDALREEIANVLEIEGFAVDTAENGRIGLERLKAQRPDLVVCDLMMPEMDGYQTLKAVRSNPGTETLPFLMLTGREERQQMRYGMELGADDYLTKPFAVKELLRAVEAAFAKVDRVERQSETKLEHLREQVAIALPHELRTPLACIMGYAEMLAEGDAATSTQDVVALAQQILGAGRRLDRISENALLYAQLALLDHEGGDFTAEGGSRATALGDVVAHQARLRAAAHGRADDLALDLSDIAVRVSRAYVAKITDELVDNAFKFSPADTPVRIATAVDEPWAMLRVSDSGAGMTQQQIGSIGGFVQFERAVREQQGLGLGLSIASRAVKIWGGSLAVESTAAGTTVTVRFPMRSDRRAGDATRSSAARVRARRPR